MKKSTCFFLVVCFFAISINLQAQWINTANFPSFGGGVLSLAVSGNNLYAGTLNAGVFLTSDEGENWIEANSGLTDNQIWSLAVSASSIYAGTENGVFITTDNGSNWSEASSGLTDGTVYSFVVSGSDLFAGTDDGVFLSTNNGTNWTDVSAGLPDGWIRALTVSGTNLFASAGFGVYLSTDNGSNWNEVSSGLPDNRIIYSLAVIGTSLFAGTSGAGVYVSTNNGTNWDAANSGLENDDVWALAVSGTSIFAGTENNGVLLSANNSSDWVNTEYELGSSWALALTETDIFAAGGLSRVAKRPLAELITDFEDEREIIPAVWKLNQNYPNPFNPSTMIIYQIPEAGFVVLKVYDILGKEVKTLVNENNQAGSYNIRFDASDLASGFYIYQIMINSYISSKKMLLIK